MKVEQPRELNALVDDSIPLTWSSRWQRFRDVVPLVALLAAFVVEGALLAAWLEDRLDAPTALIILFGGLLIFALHLVPVECEMRSRHRAKRALEAKDKGVVLKPMRRDLVPWDWIKTFRFEPFSQRSDLVKLTVEYAAGRKSKFIRRWSMALSKTEQVGNLTSELEFRRQRGTGSFALLRLAEPLVAPPVAQKMALVPCWVGVIGLYLLAHGIPLLFISFPDHDKGSDARRAKIERVSKKAAQPSRFATKADWLRARIGPHRILIGGTLTGLGAGFYAWGMVLIFRTKESGPMPQTDSSSAQGLASAVVKR